MTSIADLREMRPRIIVFGIGGAGGNAINNMIAENLEGVEFIAANTDAQALAMSKASRLIQLGVNLTGGLGAGSEPQVGRLAAEESLDEIMFGGAQREVVRYFYYLHWGTPEDVAAQCAEGIQPCGLAGQSPCPVDFYCVTGCCQPIEGPK